MKKILILSALVLSSINIALAESKSKIAIIIDDIGYQYKRDKAIIDLEGDITYAILPNTPYSITLAEYANKQGKDVILHLPMQGSRDNIAEPGTLTKSLSKEEFKKQVDSMLNSVPHIIGLNNHMGSVLTKQDKQMGWLMEAITESNLDLFYVDSLTSQASIAKYVALAFNIPTVSRDIFLDSIVDEAHIQRSFDRLIEQAQRWDNAVAIGHPHAETLTVLKRNIKKLHEHNIELVPISSMVSKRRRLTLH